MLHFEIVLRLNEAKKETDSFGVIACLGKKYVYGYVLKNSGEYEATTLSKPLEKSEMLDNNEFKNNVEALVKAGRYDEKWFKNIEESIESILNVFKDSDNTVGEYTELKNIEDIVDYLDRKKLDFLIFSEDEIWD